MARTLLVALALSLFPTVAFASPPVPKPAEGPWDYWGQTDGVSVYNRTTPGSPIKEVRAEGTFEAPPAAVWAVLRDIGNYVKTMPYIQVSRILGQADGGKTIFYYSILALPIVSDRDYSLRVVAERTPADGGGSYHLAWYPANDYPTAPPPQSKYVRLDKVSGYWTLEPIRGGTATHGVYYVHTDPKSPLPSFLVNKANSDAVPRLFNALRQWSKKPPYAQAK